MTPSVVIALAPSPMRHIENQDTHAARCLDESAQMRQQVHGLGDRLGFGPELASIAQQVVIGIDEQQSGPTRIIIVQRQVSLPSQVI